MGRREPSACKRAGCSACGNWPKDQLHKGARAHLDKSPRERRYFDGVLKECGCGGTCKNFLQMYLAYARYHRAVTDNDPRVAPTARILVVENAWRTYGLGHMAPTAAQWLTFGMVSGRVIYFANEAEWNWLDYFEAYLGEAKATHGAVKNTRWIERRHLYTIRSVVRKNTPRGALTQWKLARVAGDLDEWDIHHPAVGLHSVFTVFSVNTTE